MQENDLISVYITFKNEDEAEKICKVLLDQKLIACANLYPIKSMYWWEGEIENSSEFASVIKSHFGKWEAIQRIIEELHSYEVPCIVMKKIETNEAYGDWILESLK